MGLKVKVHEAGLHDSVGAKLVLEGLTDQFTRMRKVWTDHAYRVTVPHRMWDGYLHSCSLGIPNFPGRLSIFLQGVL